MSFGGCEEVEFLPEEQPFRLDFIHWTCSLSTSVSPPDFTHSFRTVKLPVEIGIQVMGLVRHECAEWPVRRRDTAITLVNVLTASDRRSDSLVGVPGNTCLNHRAVLPTGGRSTITQRALPLRIFILHKRQDGLLHAAIVRRTERLQEHVSIPFQPNR